MANNGTVVLALGQRAVAIAGELNTVLKSRDVQSVSAICVDFDVERSTSGSEVFHLSTRGDPRGDGTVFSTNLVQGDEPDNITSFANLMERITSKLESKDSVQGISLISELAANTDVTSQLSLWLKEYFPHISLACTFLQPIEGAQGLSSLRSLISIQSAIEIADGLMCRGYVDAMAMLSAESANISTQEIHRVIASDLVAANFLRPDFSDMELWKDMSWPLQVCSLRSKIFDVRSSMWRANRAQKTKSKSAPQYNAMRAVANNLHSLHISHISTGESGHFSSLTDATFDATISTASIVDIRTDRINRSLVSAACGASGSDVATLLKWATPSVEWPENLGYISRKAETASSRLMRPLQHSLSASARGTGMRREGVHLYPPSTTSSTASTTSFRSGSVSGLSRAGSQSQLETIDISGVSNPSRRSRSSSTLAASAAGGRMRAEENEKHQIVSAIAFESPYAQDYLRQGLTAARRLLDQGAYAHRFSEGYYEDLFYYHDFIEDYLEGCSCISTATSTATATATTGMYR